MRTRRRAPALLPLRVAFDTALPDPSALALLALFPFVIWGADEFRRYTVRRREARMSSRVPDADARTASSSTVEP